MDMNDLVLVSVDDHLGERPGMFTHHILAKYNDSLRSTKDMAPKVIERQGGIDARAFGGQEATNVGLKVLRSYNDWHIDGWCGTYPGRSHIPKEQRTAGALRAPATDVDVGYRSSERLKKTGTATVSVLDLAEQLPS